MKITVLVENTEGHAGCGAEHGLSLYVETDRHKLLMDTGASDLLLQNAEKLGVDLTQVDTVVLSHGHYDHGGGILPFVQGNPHADIWLHHEAFGEFYSERPGKEPHYIGLDPKIRDLPQLYLIGGRTDKAATEAEPSSNAAQGTEEGICRIDEELFLFTDIGTARPLPPANASLKEKTAQGMEQENFRHELCLVIRHGEKRVLFSGCAHHGMLNILDRYKALFGGAPDVVISGFHMMKKDGYTEADIDFITDTALELKEYPTIFYTGHCTGVIPYEAMRKLMGRQVRYLHAGDVLTINGGKEAAGRTDVHSPEEGTNRSGAANTHNRKRRKGRRSYMKAHRFFAWAAVFCFIMTMITGYQRK